MYIQKNECVAIIPYRKIGGDIEIGGGIENLDFVDIVYDLEKLSSEGYIYFFDFCKKQGATRLSWRYLNDGSTSQIMLEKALQSEAKVFSKTEYINVAISFEDRDYDKYFNNLTKSVRQNLRTSYNRMKREGVDYSFEYLDFEEERLDKASKQSIKQKCLDVYDRRLSNKYGSSFAHRLFRIYGHYVTRTMFWEKTIMAYLSIDGELAGFMQGYFDSIRNQILVPRLAINEKFNFYSPGYLLVNEMIKEMINRNILVLNLDRGGEKYKYDLGEQEYKTISYVIEL